MDLDKPSSSVVEESPVGTQRNVDIDVPIIIVAHRGPVTFSVSPEGNRVIERGSGGLVTGLTGLVTKVDRAMWLCSPITEEDEVVANEHPSGTFKVDTPGGTIQMRFVPTPSEAHQNFYALIANPLLWFTQHGLWDLSNAPSITASDRISFENGYVEVNRVFADATAQEVANKGGQVLVMIHDYHFYLVGSFLRRRCPDAFLLHFVHIPWPQPDLWRVLPSWMREPLIEGLLANDIVAFHTERYARNFLLTCEELLGKEVDYETYTVRNGKRAVAVRWYPISVDVEAFEALASSQEVNFQAERLENIRREFLVVRVDRTDLSKNILRGFEAFDKMLDDHEDLAGRVTFLALLQPSRQDVDQYVEYMEKIRRLVADINLKHGNTDWQPIDLRFDDNFAQSVAAYKVFDVLLVNPLFDGMNLVAKEAILVNARNGVLVLSEHAGVYDEIGLFTITVHPCDIQQQADAIFSALMMSAEEKQRRRTECLKVIKENDIDNWFSSQLEEVSRLWKTSMVPHSPRTI